MNASNEQTQFEDFYRHEAQAVYRYVYSRVFNHEDALEVVQESFLTLYRLHQDGQGGECERALLFRLARNRAIDLLRRKRARENFAQERATGNVLVFKTAEPRTPEEILLEKERGYYAAVALDQLSERDQECLALRRCGLSYREVAEVLRVNPQSVGQLIARALRRFTDAYEALLRTKPNDENAEKTRRE